MTELTKLASFLTATAAGADAAAEVNPTMAMLIQIAPFAILIVVFYFMLIRPQRKRDKAEKEMRRNLEVGDEVTTNGGIVGRVSNIKDDIITIETGANRVKINVQRWSIAAKEEKISD